MMRPERLIVQTEQLLRGDLWKIFPVICVDRTRDIPVDYPGAMGVPISAFDKLDRERFEILGMTDGHQPLVNGRTPYRRIVIRNLQPELPDEIDLAEWFARMGEPLEVEFGEDGTLPDGDCMAVDAGGTDMLE